MKLYFFLGGDSVARAALVKQLSCLERLPLKDALERAFGLDDSRSLEQDSSQCTFEVSFLCYCCFPS